MMLKKFLLPSLAVLSLAAPITAEAESLMLGQPGAGATFQIADQDAVFYYLENGDVFEVITTIALGPKGAEMPVRFQNLLAEGEQQKLSIGGYGGQTSATDIILTRKDDQIAIIMDDDGPTIEARLITD